MHMSKPEKKPLVPALRFPEFQNAEGWKKTRLGKIGEFIGGGTPETSVAEYWDGDIQWFTPSEVKEKYLSKSKRTITEKGLKNSSAKLLPKGTLLLSTRATVGDVGIATIPCSTNQGFQSLLVNESETNIFWYYWLIHHKNELVRKSSGSTFLEIGKNEVQKVEALRPTVNEQQKIADCLSSIDDLITAQTQKLAALKAHKKGLMQQLFPAEGETVPKLRFPEFRDGGEWKSYHLEEVASFLKGKGISKADIAIDGKLPCIRYGELYTFYGEVIGEVNSRTNLPPKNLVLSKANDVIIPASGETQEDIATASCVKKDGIALGGDLNIIRTKNNGVFLAYYLNSAKKKDIAQMAQGISVVHLYANQLKALNVQLPEIREQRKIADCLSSVDELITAQSQKIEALKSHKKGLMQQLFPSMDEVDG